jgi:hypothetical protein
MLFPHLTTTETRVENLTSDSCLPTQLDKDGYIYVLKDDQTIGILLSMKTFKKLHAFAQEKIMDKLRSYGGY